MNPQARAQPGWRHAGFFQLRTPLFPLADLLAFTAGPEPVHERLRTFLMRAGMREALQLASPALLARLDTRFDGTDGGRGDGDDLHAALYRFIARSCGRATPFGLFAGTATGTVQPAHALQLAAREHWRRHTTLDAAFAHALASDLGQALGGQLVVHANPRAFAAAGRLRYIAAREGTRGSEFTLVGVEPDAPLQAAIECASNGARIEEVCNAIAAALPPDIEARHIDAYVQELVQMDLLVPAIEPPLTGRDSIDALEAMASALRDDGAHAPSAQSWRARIADVRRRCEEADQLRIDEPSQLARDIPHIFDTGKGDDRGEDGLAEGRPRASANEAARPHPALQVDLHTRLARGALGERVTQALHGATQVLQRLFRTRGSRALAAFREQFEARHGSREIPLLAALDDEIGIAFGNQDSPDDDPSPLLAGLHLGAPPAAPATFGTAEQFLLPRVAEVLRTGAGVLQVQDADLEHWERSQRLPPCTPLPDAFTVLAALSAEDDDAVNAGRFELLHLGAGAQGAALLGRFCHGDAALLGHVRAWLAQEQALHPQAVLAELVYRPGIRLANVARRPLLRDYEIPVVGRSGAPAVRQLALADLHVSVVDGRMRLRSQRLDREVLPRHSSALDVQRPGTPGVLRFLAALAQQQGVGVKFGWGALASLPVLPRVAWRNVVLAPARWRLDARDLAPLRAGVAAGLHAHSSTRARDEMAALRERLRLPRLVGLAGTADVADGDAPLPLDLDCELAIGVLASHARTGAILVEWFPACGTGGIPGEDGRHAHEIVVPYLRIPSPTDAQGRGAGPNSGRETGVRPGSRIEELPTRDDPGWCYVKLHGSRAEADRLLALGVAPLVAGALQEGLADRWFFLRYEDPSPHIRLRLHASSAAHVDALHARLRAAAAAWTHAGWIHAVQSDTYQPEYTRFGGVIGLQRAEALFHADSDAVLSLLREAPAVDERWLHAAVGTWHLLLDAGLDAGARLALLAAIEADFAQEFAADAALHARIGARHREQRARLAAALAAPPPAWIARRSERAKAILRALAAEAAHGSRQEGPSGSGHAALPTAFATLLRTFVHLHVNRVCRSSARAHEFVLVSLLVRHARSELARADHAGRAGR